VTFHPVRDWLNQLQWDGIPRIGNWLSAYIGTEDTPYTRGVGERWLISAVSRAMTPGVIVNSMLIIEGPQDAGKSRALKILTNPDWFKDTAIDFSNKDKFSALRGVWIYELAEFDQYKGQDVGRVKSFMSSASDTYRPSYGRSDVKQMRGCVFVGSVNPDKYLTDLTGNKRYWPVKILKHNQYNPINFDRIEKDREQIWAEAVRRYYDGAPAYIDNIELKKLHEQEARNRVDDEDTWEHDILVYMESAVNRKGATLQTAEILQNVIRIPLERQGNIEKGRVKRILERNGFEFKSVRLKGIPTKTWARSLPIE
jgi:predicted P-loop ATPase